MTLNPKVPNEKHLPENPAFSSDVPPYSASASFSTHFATISLHGSDRLRLLQFPAHDVDAIRAIIQSAWKQGIQKEQIYGSSKEFKLGGYPWQGYRSEGTHARVLMREIFAYLFSVGWILHASVDVSKSVFDKDTLVFRKQQSAPPPSEWIAISFNEGDKLRLIGADSALKASFGGMLNQMGLLQREEWKEQGVNAWQFKLHGYPWRPTGEETMQTRILVIRMLETLEREGWSLYASVDQNEGSEKSGETDSWYCVKEKGWVPGKAVFHR
jgi:hypothetical protein